jgi:hypothetical protein
MGIFVLSTPIWPWPKWANLGDVRNLRSWQSSELYDESSFDPLQLSTRRE